MPELSVPIRFVRAALGRCEDRGLDPTRLLLDAGISPHLLRESHSRVSVERYAALQVSIMLAMDDEGLGLYQRRLPVGTWSMMCFAVTGAPTLRVALKRYCRFFSLLDFGLQLSLDEADGMATVTFRRTPPDWQVELFVSDRALFKCHRFSCWLAQEEIPVAAIGLAHPQPDHADEYRYMYPGATAAFSVDQSFIRFPSPQLDKPVRHDEVSIRQFLRNPALALLTQQYAKTSWTLKVRQILRQDMMRLPSMEQVAELLSIHPQSLRRRLGEEGTSFTQIVNSIRRDTALHFLGKHGMSVEEVGYRAGFAETSTFIRAFKRWTGVTPYAYRKGTVAA